MWGRSTHCGRGGYTSGALHRCKRIAHVENCEVLGWYSAMIARHDGGKSAPIVAASHAFFFLHKIRLRHMRWQSCGKLRCPGMVT